MERAREVAVAQADFSPELSRLRQQLRMSSQSALAAVVARLQVAADSTARHLRLLALSHPWEAAQEAAVTSGSKGRAILERVAVALAEQMVATHKSAGQLLI